MFESWGELCLTVLFLNNGALPAACTFLSGEGWARHLSDATDGVLGFLCSGFPALRPVRIRPCGRRPEGAVLLRPRPCAHQALCSSSPVPISAGA